MESLIEISQFLNLTGRIDLKEISMQHILGMSGNRNNVLLITKCNELLEKLIILTNDESEIIRKEAILCLINISAEEEGAVTLLELEKGSKDNRDSLPLISTLLGFVLDPKNKLADVACKALCNITRPEANLEYSVEMVSPKLPNILDSFTNIKYNKSGPSLDYLGPLLSNLSCSKSVRDWLYEEDESGVIRAVRIASFSQYQDSAVRRGGAAGTLRNICFDTNRHLWLLGPEMDILPCLLLPLTGPEEYDDDEMDALPPSLQYLPPDKEREQDPDIRILLLEALNRLCTKRAGREVLRSRGCYYILRELHKWERDRKALLACENVVDILIRKENEMGNEDITAVDVPEEYHEKFIKVDEEFVNSNG